MKKCCVCKTEKETTEFYKNKSQKDGFAHVCKECDKASSLRWAKENREKINARNADWAKRNPEKAKARKKKWRLANLERARAADRALRERNIESCKKSMAKWQAANKHIVVYHMSKRRAAKLNASPKWLSPSDLDAIKEFYKMAKIKTAETGIKHNVDHIVPLQGKTVSGLHVPWNLQVIPAKENFSKNNKLLEDFNAPAR
jgi:hypothetical protein